MWRMICEGESGIKVQVKHVVADDRHGEAQIVVSVMTRDPSADRARATPIGVYRTCPTRACRTR
jgi:hypothetical protein